MAAVAEAALQLIDEQPAQPAAATRPRAGRKATEATPSRAEQLNAPPPPIAGGWVAGNK